MKTIEEMIRDHGTPRQFAEAVWKAVGEISVWEAQTAIAKYEREFHDAAMAFKRSADS